MGVLENFLKRKKNTQQEIITKEVTSELDIGNIFVYDEIERKYLSKPFFKVNFTEQYSQDGEDIVVASLLRAYAFFRNIDITKLKYCEIGANHPIATSATYLLHKKFGMLGVLVEANRNLIAELERERSHDKILNVAIIDNDEEYVNIYLPPASELSSLDKGFVQSWPGEGGGSFVVSKVKTMRINELLKTYFKKEEFAFLSIDVEGLDLNLLKDIDYELYRPYVIQVEPSDHYNNNNGLEIISFLEKKGYIFMGMTNVNSIFIDKKQL